MKKLLSVMVLVALVTGLSVGIALAESSIYEGTVVKFSPEQSITINSENGNETFEINDDTFLSGAISVGQEVYVEVMKGIATYIEALGEE